MSTRRVRAGSDGSREPYVKEQIVVVDLPEDRPPVVLERAEVVLAMRVVILRKVVERAHAVEDGRLLARGAGRRRRA